MNKKPTDRSVILFDFDGTLVNTTPLILHSFRATWQHSFGFTLDDSLYINTFGTLLHTALQQLTQQGIDDGRIAPIADLPTKADELLRTYREFNGARHDELCEPFAEVKETLAELKGRGHRLGIVSSKLRAGVERGLRLFALQEFFAVIIAADDVTRHKPHPEPLWRALERFEAAPHHALYVGDSIHDIAAGRAANMTTAAAAWGPFPRTELEAQQPDYVLETPAELLKLF
ncbi:MAG: HAD-IA family hydrolase [Acidobacteria bacterium]|nr:HAD-IA family hydrolase [Acidobacteriota bacterium]MBI3422185.1 HAD-IA family hydrolase [Acidobacteriota bacterium]